LIQGLEQMIMQKQQIDENIPLLETEVEVVTTKIAHLTKYLGIEEEE
jgi:prefoldin subunit 5